jgi:hypothetical protein
MEFCDCEDAQMLDRNNRELFKIQDPYGWVLSWIELTQEKGYTQVHRYGIKINYCPMCGKKIPNEE